MSNKVEKPTDVHTTVYKSRMFSCRSCSMTSKEYITGTMKCQKKGCDLVTIGTLVHTQTYAFFEEPYEELEDVLTEQESDELDAHVEYLKEKARDRVRKEQRRRAAIADDI